MKTTVVTAPDHTEQPLRLLSLDGGGVRGLSALYILRYLMKLLNPESPPKPCDYFDLIGGTSTGGLIAIMLGRLHMDIDECIAKYELLTDSIFHPKRSKVNVFKKGKDLWKLDGSFDSEKLEQEIRNVIKNAGEDENGRFIEETPQCKIFVCAMRSEITRPILFKNYRGATQVDEIDCAIWEAARATSAASSFFKHITIQNQRFTDGATGYNNPIDLVLEEACQVWPDATTRIERLVSIGTGRPELRAFGNNLKQLGASLIKISTDTQNAADRFERTAFRDHHLHGKYFRFDVSHGLGDVGLESSREKGKIVAATNNYLNEHTVNLSCRAFAIETPIAPTAATQRWYLRRLQSYNVRQELNDIPKPIGNTLRWVLQSPEFQKWTSQEENAVLLIVGQPGCGKTVLSAFLYGEFYEEERAYFACTESEDARRKPAMIISSLLRQTLQNQPHLFRYVLKDCQSPLNWSYKQLLDSFDAVINSSDHKGIICVIDGLDECHVALRKQFTRDLKRIFLQSSGRKSGYARLIVTARQNYDDIEALTNNRLNLDTSEDMKSDLKVFIQQRVEDLVVTRPEYEPRIEFLVRKLLALSTGMYRLVELLIDDLENSNDSTDAGVRRILTALPGDIANIYTTIWNRIPPKSRSRAQRMFSWLLCSMRPLTKEEIAIGTALDVLDTKQRAQLRNLDISKDILGDLRRLFGPLIRIGSTIELSHQTVRDHFLKQEAQGVLETEVPYIMNTTESNSSIALACLRFLNAVDFDLKGVFVFDNEPGLLFLDYALRFMSQHVALSTSKSQIYEDQIINFFNSNLWLDKWTQNLKPGMLSVSQVLWRPTITTAVAFAAQLNLPKLLEKVLMSSEAQYAPSERDCSDTFHLLYEAVIGGGKECVSLIIRSFDEILLFTPLDCERLLRTTARSSIESSSSYGRDVELIISQHEDAQGQSFIHKNRFDEILDLIRGRQQRGRKIVRSELEIAILELNITNAYENLSTPASFLDSEASSHLCAETLYNATLLFCLYVSWTYGDDATKLLIPESPSLYEAIKSGYYSAVELLIQHGAGVLFCDDEGNSALHAAAQTGSPELVELILKQRILNVNARNEKGLTPLHFACLPLHLWESNAILEPRPPGISRSRVIQLLLNAGAEVRARDIHGNTAFQTLARIYVPEWEEVAKDSELNWREQDLNECISLLLMDIIDLIVWDSYGTTPLHYASSLWPMSAIQKLINYLDEHYLAPTLLDYAGNSPLHYAAVRGFESPEEVVRQLAYAGVEARLKNVFGETALTIARRQGHLKVQKELESIHRALNDEVRNREVYNTWMSAPKSPFEVRQIYAPLNQPFPTMINLTPLINLTMKPRFMQLYGATDAYASYPSTEYIHRLAETFTLTGISSNAAPDLLHVLLATPLTIQLDFENLSMNLDPFAGVGLIPIRRPIAPGRMKYLKTINSNDDDFRDTLEQELQGFSPLQRKDSGGLSERGFHNSNRAMDDSVDEEAPRPRNNGNSPYQDYDPNMVHYLGYVQIGRRWSFVAYFLVILSLKLLFLEPIIFRWSEFLRIYPLGNPRYDGWFLASDFQNLKAKRWPWPPCYMW